ncbi:MAG: ribonuclease P protein component [Rhodomicrobium sp.]|nr:ribonuclease P protein component [Rhodomicrobium sp.]
MKKRSDYLALRSGAKAGAPGFLLTARQRADGGEIRVGITVTRKLGGAVVRNRIRRRLKEAARAVLPLHGEPGCDYVLIARPAAQTRVFAALLDDLKRALLTLRRAAS